MALTQKQKVGILLGVSIPLLAIGITLIAIELTHPLWLEAKST